PAGGEHVGRALHVGVEVLLEAAPGTGLGGDVEHRVLALAGVQHGLELGEVAAQLAHAERVQFGIVATVEAGGRVAALDQPAADRLAEEAAAAGDQDVHAPSSLPSRCAAKRASASRPILALWRMSTGNAGWNRKRWMPRVPGWRAA